MKSSCELRCPKDLCLLVTLFLLTAGSVAVHTAEGEYPVLTEGHVLRQGPFIGHVEPTRAFIWGRAHQAGNYSLEVFEAAKKIRTVKKSAVDTSDYCLVWELDGLTPGQTYRYSVSGGEGEQAVVSGSLRTARRPTADGAVRLFFGSCADEKQGVNQLWNQARREAIDVVVLLGDSPYIDSTELLVQRQRYAAFASVPGMAALLRSTSWYGTWDDHDFGANDIDGRLEGKDRARRAFIEYHANPSYGDGQHGVYTRFRRGAVEVFLLDTRYFAATEPSPFGKHKASLLGASQWEWLLEGLKQSTAPVKVLACGMIWNAATRPGKPDHWGAYPHELEALFKYIGEEDIGGVVLVGGDIHRSRVLRHATEELAGYNIYELISSPMHESIIETANAPHPGLVKDMGVPNSFMLLEAAQIEGRVSSLEVRFLDKSGDEHYRIDLTESMHR